MLRWLVLCQRDTSLCGQNSRPLALTLAAIFERENLLPQALEKYTFGNTLENTVLTIHLAPPEKFKDLKGE